MTAQATLIKLSREEVYQRIVAMPDGRRKNIAAFQALQLYGAASEQKKFLPYRFDAENYIKEFLHWTPWRGSGQEKPGQVEIIDAYNLALKQQFEKRDFEKGLIKEEELTCWKPDMVIQNWIRMEAGHNVGKTKIESGLICHFFDCFVPSTVRMYAPSYDTLKDNLWEELSTDRTNNDLPGKLLKTIEIRGEDENHSIKGRAVSNSKGKGSAKIQGKHGEFLLFVLDEAEGLDDFVFDAIKSMASGGIYIVLMAANPQTRTSKFHKLKDISNVTNFRISCINHPNVVFGREDVPHAVQRSYVRDMVEEHCEIKQEHNEDKLTFTLDFPIVIKKEIYPVGTIFQPNAEFMWRVLGIAPSDVEDNKVITVGRYEAAKKRKDVFCTPEDYTRATFGIDVALWGKDYGTLYVRWRNEIWRAKQWFHQDSKEYFHFVRDLALELAAKGVQKLHMRVDAGGEGLITTAKHNLELREAFKEVRIIPVHFGGNAFDKAKYDDLVTEMYYQAKETLSGVRLLNPPEALETDLTLREWEPVNRSGKEIKKLQDKKSFKKVIKRSPDDGDGFVLAAAPDFIFKTTEIFLPRAISKESRW
jgi:hypothetical protein